MQNEPHNKRVMYKYLRNIFVTNFSKYSKVNPTRKNNLRPDCIITITCCNYSAFMMVLPHLINLHPRILVRVHNA